ncbi:M28 family peptidase [Thalassotalea ponticola]|uniref:M28 family peptidase n=1 Tax=Thalassotalea ponticola TaxID=1523392 RepID=UPI0025B5F12C|nr:M28 family peptidase [Thalassotalea ponticola]MDN3652202.1 M28 family peptidase [Thalassotalea ponticola]
MKSITTTLASLTLTVASALASVNAAQIDLAKVTQDMQFLASDAMQGRAIGSQQIELAEDYIVEQFKQAGLTPLAQLNGFKQHFTLYKYTPEQIAVTLNGVTIDSQDIAFSASGTVDLTTENSRIVYINKQQKLAPELNSINQSGGNTLVVIAPEHRSQFVQYQRYLSRGSMALSEKNGDGLVMVISEQQAIEQFSAKGNAKQQRIALANVVGVLTANEPTDEYVIFSAHHDHVGTTKALDANQDIIYNGANDDASGVSAVLNLARYYQQKQRSGNLELKRNIMFVSFTAEESGLLGSKAFVDQVDTDDIVAMINIEMIGKPSEFGPGKIWMTGFDRSNLGHLLNSAHGKQTIYADPYPEYNLFYRSDNASLARAGVPAHSVSSTQINNDLDYHKVTDEIDTLDIEQMRDIIDTLGQASVPLLTGEVTPHRIDGVSASGVGAFF